MRLNELTVQWSQALNNACVFQLRDVKSINTAAIMANTNYLFDTMAQRQHCIRARQDTLQAFGELVEDYMSGGKSERDAQRKAATVTKLSVEAVLAERTDFDGSANYYATLEALQRDLVSALEDK